VILPGATLGLLGGGQLGRMFTVAARTLGYRVTVLDPDPCRLPRSSPPAT
jgi:5-(carboxyamino)imidazole ribonucleotide synthase